MSILNWFKPRAQATAPAPTLAPTPVPAPQLDIDLAEEGLHINGQLLPQITRDALAALLGEPRIIPPQKDKPEDSKTLVIWDEAGVYGFSADGQKISELALRLADDPQWQSSVKFDFQQMRPHSIFAGQFTVAGQRLMGLIPDDELGEAYLFVELKRGNWQIDLSLCEAVQAQIAALPFAERSQSAGREKIARLLRSSPAPFRDVEISRKPAKKAKAAKASSDKWKLPQPVGEQLVFEHLPFKLAVVQELMYGQGLLKPEFDVYDFARGYAAREIDPDDYYDEMIPEVEAWFTALPIAQSLAAHVQRLYFDGGNDIYLQLIPQWDGEDDQFNITALSAQELAQFPMLRKVAGAHWLSESAQQLLRERGIAVLD